MQMGRHWRAAGVQFAVKVGELPASIFQEEPAPEREQSAGKVHKEHGNHDQDRRFVLVNQQEAIGNEEGPPTRFRFIRRPCLPRCPASEVQRIQSDAATVELADGAAQNALEAIGAIRANAIGTTNTISNIQNDSLSGDPNLNTEVSVLNKVNATNVLSLENAQDTNKLLVAILEQQTIVSKQLRDSATNVTNADINRRQNAVGLNQQLTGGIGQALNGYQLP